MVCFVVSYAQKIIGENRCNLRIIYSVVNKNRQLPECLPLLLRVDSITEYFMKDMPVGVY
jgi:hypothetical protein